MASTASIPQDVHVSWVGSTPLWRRKVPAGTDEREKLAQHAFLRFRKSDEMPVPGSISLMRQGSEAKNGQYFTAEEVEAYITIYKLRRDQVYVFEYTLLHD